MYLTLPWCVWWLWPEIIWRELTFVAVAVASFTLPSVVGLIKFRRFTSYHTWGAKLSAVLMGVSMLLLFTGGSPWPFRISTVIFALAELEEIAITMVLPRWEADVRSIVHALRLSDTPSAERRTQA
jgi:CDP-diacylglycerol--glycerol-3-phosphate 3-phosphatidyltransferase